MQFLQEIIGLSYFHFYPAIEQFLPQGAKNQQLYRAIRDGEVTTDEEASQLIYGTPQAGKKYTMLKQRLKLQVINNYFQQLSQAGDKIYAHPLRHRLDYLKQLTIVHTLIRQGRYALARQLLHYQQKAAAAQFDFTTVQEGLQLLRQIASYEGDRPAFRRYDAQFKKTTRQANRLREAHSYYHAVRLEWHRHLPPSAAVATLARKYTATTQQWQRQNRNPAIGFYSRLINLIMLFHQGDLARFRRILFFQKEHIKRNPILATDDPVAQADLLAMEYLATLHPKDQSLIVQQTIQGSRDESLPVAAWLGLREVECIHWLRTADYRRAKQLCQQLETEAAAETYMVSPHDRGRWMLFQAYASYLLRSNATEAATIPLANEEVAVQPLLNDASGYGWQWFIFKILRWLEQPFLSTNHFLRQIDTYGRRHSANQSERGVQFFQQLRALVAQRAGRKKTNGETSLLSLPSPSTRDHLQELIPYETLWQTITDHATQESNATEESIITAE